MEDEDMLPDGDLSNIEEGLYLGNLTSALDTQTLKKHRISHILSVDSKPLPTNITYIPGMSFHYIEVDDMANEDLLSHFEEANAFLAEGQEKGNVLVHCFFGISRSATLVMAFLMHKYKLTLDEAFDRVKARRRCIGPNAGFLKQLLVYQFMGWTVSDTNINYRLYKMSGAAFSMTSAFSVKKDSSIEFREKFQDLIQPDPRISIAENDKVAFRCKKCRSVLVCQGSVLPHIPGENPGWCDGKWSKFEKLSLCTQAIYTLPIAWMGDLTSELEGKLSCPKCQNKLGSYSWKSGHLCPCGAKIKPAFHIVPSKVDKCL